MATTNQALMPNFAQQVALMQQANNFYISFLYGHGSVPLRRGLTFFFLAGLLSCSNLGQSGFKASSFRIGVNVTPIRELKLQQDLNTGKVKAAAQTKVDRKQMSLDNATVYIQGKVEKQVPLLQRRLYQINDSTGKIWVITNQTGLREGDQVVIKGQLRYQNIPLGGKEYGEVYLEEQWD